MTLYLLIKIYYFLFGMGNFTVSTKDFVIVPLILIGPFLDVSLIVFLFNRRKMVIKWFVDRFSSIKQWFKRLRSKPKVIPEIKNGLFFVKQFKNGSIKQFHICTNTKGVIDFFQKLVDEYNGIGYYQGNFNPVEVIVKAMKYGSQRAYDIERCIDGYVEVWYIKIGGDSEEKSESSSENSVPVSTINNGNDKNVGSENGEDVKRLEDKKNRKAWWMKFLFGV